MKTRKILAMILTALMVIAILPVGAIASGLEQAAEYRRMWKDTDSIWDKIESTVAEMDKVGASKEEIINAVYEIAAAGRGIVTCEIENGETVRFVHESGMENAYSWRVNHSKTRVQPRSEGSVETTLKSIETASSLDVLLLGPYYGYDSSFTNQYRNEVQSIAEYTEGSYTIYSGHEVDADACRRAEDYGVIVFDSHGICTGGRSYLCLTTNAGFTNEDYTEHRAMRSGSEAWVTGAFWEYYCPNMKGAIVWMAICEGMMSNTLGGPLLNAGCGVVYGYSQSVTFAGDYKMEKTFWNHMKNGETFVEAYDAMIAAHGNYDPYGDAYPVVMSEFDEYPANPDSHQTVYCTWHLPKPSDLVVTDVTGVSFEQDTYGIAPTFTQKIVPIITPEGANNYKTEWISSDPSVATVSNKGVVTGVKNGSAVITFKITSSEYSNTSYTYSASVNVIVSNAYLPAEVMYVPVNEIVPGETYLIGYTKGTRTVVMGNDYYDANNSRTLKPVDVTIGEIEGVVCIPAQVDKGAEWIWGADGSIRNNELGKYLTLSGNYLAMGDTPIVWSYAPTAGATTGMITNSVSSTFKYLGMNNNMSYFSVFLSGYELQLYRKLVREAQPAVPGDATGDGTVTSADALLILRYAFGDVAAIPEANIGSCDMNGDGVITSADALIVLRQTMGL